MTSNQPPSSYDFVPLPDRVPLRFPGGAHVAVIFTINIEYWEAFRTGQKEPLFPGGPATIPHALPGDVLDTANWTWREYGQRVGIWRIIDVFDKMDVAPSCTCNGMIMEERRRIVDAVRERGWELVPHNWAQNDLLTYYAHDPGQERAVIRRTLDKSSGKRVYSAAYIMPSGGGFFGHRAKHQNHLRMIEHAMHERFPARLREMKSMADAFALLRSIPFVGPFLAYQYVADLNYSELTNFGEDEFVVAGPGALDGISKCFQDARDLNPADVIRYMYDNQERHFAEQHIAFRTLWGRRLQLIDCQNVFCEISKYARAAFPDYAGISGRTRIKQKFKPTGALPSPWYPPKWDINAHVPTSRL